jgi:hypothetical protein
MADRGPAGRGGVSEADRAAVEALLGREPRGLEAIAVTDASGRPRVIRVASLVDGKPFPTLFWLVDAELCYRIDGAEAGGLIQRLQARVDADDGLRRTMAADHRAHIALRESHMSETVRAGLERSGYLCVLSKRGIGGIADFARIRCLHTWYAAHLVVPNTIGRLLDAHWGAADPLTA